MTATKHIDQLLEQHAAQLAELRAILKTLKKGKQHENTTNCGTNSTTNAEH